VGSGSGERFLTVAAIKHTLAIEPDARQLTVSELAFEGLLCRYLENEGTPSRSPELAASAFFLQIQLPSISPPRGSQRPGRQLLPTKNVRRVCVSPVKDASIKQPTAPRRKRWQRFFAWLFGFAITLAVFVYFTREFWLTTLRSYYIGRTYVAAEEYGRFLPAVDEVEILALAGEAAGGQPDSFPPDIGPRIGTVNRHTVRGADAESIRGIWRSISFDRHFAAICHQPYYALRFRHHGKLILETSVCWECSTYTIPIPIFGSTQYGFDAKSEEAQKLLATLAQYAPHPPTPK
jgi:hypothetical protein